jgi:serine/threonine-protein kinase HipA
VEEKQQENIFNKMAKALPKWQELIDRSFMSDAYKEQYKTILAERMNRLEYLLKG